MKRIVILLFVALTATSCDENNLNEIKGESGISYSQSLKKWKELKGIHGNSYVYSTTFTSWTGSGSTTVIKVENGVITARYFEQFNRDENGAKTIVNAYTETGATLGTHTEGAPLHTMDELYESCARKYLVVSEKKNKLYFETGRNDVMTLCGFVPNDCADDCFKGIRVQSLEWLD